MNYCNGGTNQEYNRHIGFCGICDDQMIEYNVKVKKNAWCANEICMCSQYWDGQLTPIELENGWDNKQNGAFVCYESCALRDWSASAGVDAIGTIRKFQYASQLPGHLCVLTTIIPESDEKDRLIFAMFLIDKVIVNAYDYSHCVVADEKYRLEFYLDEIRKAKFWSVYKNSLKPLKQRWISGLFRYFENDEAVAFLKLAVNIKRGTKEENLANEFLKHYCKINGSSVKIKK